MKKKTYLKPLSHRPQELRQRLYTLYMEKYFNLFLNSYEWDGISHDQREYLMRAFWFNGSVAAFSIIQPLKKFLGTTAAAFSDSESDKGLIGFAPFDIQNYNMYDYPTTALLINVRGVPYIPKKVMVNHEDVVLGFAQHNRRPIVETISTLVKQIVNAEMAINTNINALKTPIIFTIGPDSAQHAQDFQNNLENDTPDFFANVGELDNIKALNSGVQPFFKDLYEYKKNVEGEIKTFLGLDNNDQGKRERENVDETNSNNDVINASRDSVLDCLNEFCDDIGDVLGFDISVEAKQKPVAAVSEDGDIQGGPQPGAPKGGQENGN